MIEEFTAENSADVPSLVEIKIQKSLLRSSVGVMLAAFAIFAHFSQSTGLTQMQDVRACAFPGKRNPGGATTFDHTL